MQCPDGHGEMLTGKYRFTLEADHHTEFGFAMPGYICALCWMGILLTSDLDDSPIDYDFIHDDEAKVTP